MRRFITALVTGLTFLLAATFGTLACTNPHAPAGHEGYVFEDHRRRRISWRRAGPGELRHQRLP